MGVLRFCSPLMFSLTSNSRNIFLENMMTGFIKACLNIPLQVKANSSRKNVALKLKSVKNASKRAITDLNVPNVSRDISIISQSHDQDFGQDGHCRFVGFQPHFHLNMTSQTQCCKTIKIKLQCFRSFLFDLFQTLQAIRT